LSTIVFAHRGASMSAPENTLSAFQLANKHGAHGIETDIHLTKDSVPILIHDPTLDRTTNLTGAVKDYNYDQIKDADAGFKFASSFKGENIISLPMFLEWIQDKNLKINLELKTRDYDYEKIEEIVYAYLKEFNLIDRTIISSFSPKTIKGFSKIADIETALLHSKFKWNIPKYAKKFQAKAVHIPYRLLSRRLIRQAKRENLAVRVYTVNKKKRMIRCIRYDCDAIISDIPKLFTNLD